jgi:hypothetical protein
MRTVLKLVAAAVLVLPAACSTGSGGGGTGATTSMSDADLLTLGKQLVQCLRDNGLTEMPDPYVEGHRLRLPEKEQSKIDGKYTQQQFDQAKQACRTIADKLPEGALVTGGEDERKPAGPGDVETLRKYAQCMRENGVPEWPDPKADGSFPLKGSPLAKEGPSQRIKTASEACRQIWSGGVAIS